MKGYLYTFKAISNILKKINIKFNKDFKKNVEKPNNWPIFMLPSSNFRIH